MRRLRRGPCATSLRRSLGSESSFGSLSTSTTSRSGSTRRTSLSPSRFAPFLHWLRFRHKKTFSQKAPREKSPTTMRWCSGLTSTTLVGLTRSFVRPKKPAPTSRTLGSLVHPAVAGPADDPLRLRRDDKTLAAAEPVVPPVTRLSRVLASESGIRSTPQANPGLRLPGRPLRRPERRAAACSAFPHTRPEGYTPFRYTMWICGYPAPASRVDPRNSSPALHRFFVPRPSPTDPLALENVHAASVWDLSPIDRACRTP